jgi:hypothetical protein
MSHLDLVTINFFPLNALTPVQVRRVFLHLLRQRVDQNQHVLRRKVGRSNAQIRHAQKRDGRLGIRTAYQQAGSAVVSVKRREMFQNVFLILIGDLGCFKNALLKNINVVKP